MKRTEPTWIVETWLTEGPDTAPDRIMAQLPAQVTRTPQARVGGALRFSGLLAPAGAAIILAALVLGGVLRPWVGDDGPSDLPSPPPAFGAGDRVDLVLLIENRSDRTHGSWYWSGHSGAMPFAPPCQAVVAEHRVLAPGVVRFGEVHPETEAALDRESLPVVLDTSALPGSPVAFRDDVVPVWTYAYRIAVSEEGLVILEPLDAIPSAADAGPICPPTDTPWPEGWPDVRAWLADRPALPDCGLERIESLAQPITGEPVRNTAARRCLYDAWLAGQDGQLALVTITDTGPFLEVIRTSGGAVEVVRQQLRSSVSDEVVVTTCTRLVPPSDWDGMEAGPEDDARLVFVIDPESCS
jgi:hypothetical protein